MPDQDRQDAVAFAGSRPVRRNWRPLLVIAVLFAALPLAAQFLEQPFLIRVATRVVVFSIAVVALNLILGFGGLVSFMQAALLGIGGYVVAILARHNTIPFLSEPFIIYGTANLAYSIPLAVIVSALASILFGLVALRTSGAYFIMITLAFNQMLFYFFVALERYGGEEGLPVRAKLHLAGFPVGDRLTLYCVYASVLLAVLIFAGRLVDSRFGIVLRAASENEHRVGALGIPVLRYRLAAFVLSGTIAGLAGALVAITQQFMSPADMSWMRSAEFIIMAVLGGMTTVWGPVLGTAAFVILELVLSAWTIHWQLLFGILIIALAAFLHGGLIDLVKLLPAAPRQGHG
jgi:branched-chain amino acid transport system permease protein